MAQPEAKVFERTFIVEHNGKLFRYSESLVEVADTEVIEVIDLTGGDKRAASKQANSVDGELSNRSKAASSLSKTSDIDQVDVSSVDYSGFVSPSNSASQFSEFSNTVSLSPLHYPVTPYRCTSPPSYGSLASPVFFSPTSPVYNWDSNQ